MEVVVTSTITPKLITLSCLLAYIEMHGNHRTINNTCKKYPTSCGCGIHEIHILRHLKEELAWAIDEQLWVISNEKLFKTVIIRYAST